MTGKIYSFVLLFPSLNIGLGFSIPPVLFILLKKLKIPNIRVNGRRFGRNNLLCIKAPIEYMVIRCLFFHEDIRKLRKCVLKIIKHNYYQSMKKLLM